MYVWFEPLEDTLEDSFSIYEQLSFSGPQTSIPFSIGLKPIFVDTQTSRMGYSQLFGVVTINSNRIFNMI